MVGVVSKEPQLPSSSRPLILLVTVAVPPPHSLPPLPLGPTQPAWPALLISGKVWSWGSPTLSTKASLAGTRVLVSAFKKKSSFRVLTTKGKDTYKTLQVVIYEIKTQEGAAFPQCLNPEAATLSTWVCVLPVSSEQLRRGRVHRPQRSPVRVGAAVILRVFAELRKHHRPCFQVRAGLPQPLSRKPESRPVQAVTPGFPRAHLDPHRCSHPEP